MLGNDDVNETKLEKTLGGTIRPGHPDELKELTGADAGSIGPISFKSRIIADLRLKNGNNLFSGANKNDYHIGGIDLLRDVPELEYADLRTVKPGEKCIRCGLCVEISGKDESLGLTYIGRGFDVRISVPFNETIADALKKTTAACVNTCPTGAMAFKNQEERILTVNKKPSLPNA